MAKVIERQQKRLYKCKHAKCAKVIEQILNNSTLIHILYFRLLKNESKEQDVTATKNAITTTESAPVKDGDYQYKIIVKKDNSTAAIISLAIMNALCAIALIGVSVVYIKTKRFYQSKLGK